MQKKVKTLSLIELATVLDMYGLEYEKIKRRKLRKKVKSNATNISYNHLIRFTAKLKLTLI